ncbi:polysaccharide deacetylase [Kyrpidia tusciae DSM 2912]|uniref:Polysaccharide deacetylase n=2 Tax=Kyrpidia TaxID=1129704 RepID=D5WTX2_KYRT2|nr:polysaccharide deacetylase [Kyrpidia tusciae DSM 2912]
MKKGNRFDLRFITWLVAGLLVLILPTAILFRHYTMLSLSPSVRPIPSSGPRTVELLSPTIEPMEHYRNRVLVLMYHHIDPHESDMTISPERFADHMNALQRAGYHVIGLDKLLRFALYGNPVPDNAVVITFDDGYRSFYQYAYPRLKEHHYPATNFIIVKSTDSPAPGSIPHLTWAEMMQMKKDGMTFCNHTYNLHGLAVVDAAGHRKPALAHEIFLPDKGRTETNREYEERIRRDLALAQSRLDAELGEQPKALAFPFGAYNDTVIKVAESLGIQLFFTVKPGINPPHRTLFDRIDAGTPTLTGQGLLEVLSRYDPYRSEALRSAGQPFPD